jgi:hypothetical protein
MKGNSSILLWVKRNHDKAKKNDGWSWCPPEIVYNLRFTDEDEVKNHVQKVHPKEHVNLELCMCLKVDNQGL